MSIRVSVVEDNARVRTGLVSLIELSPGLTCLSQHRTGEAALAELPRIRPDVVLMDVKLPGINGVECVRQLKPLVPQAQIVMLTVFEDAELIFQALRAGATGYLLKQTPPAELLEAIHSVHRGGSPMTGHIARKVVASLQQTAAPTGEENLTPREREVLDYLTRGFLYKEIADRMGITFETVHAHIRKVYEKLQVRSRTEAVTKHLQQARPPSGAGSHGH